MKVQNLIITGITTNYCVKSSIIDAYHLGYNIIVPEDCVSASTEKIHINALKDIAEYA